ncbi:MAG: deoxycytidylate deaminase [Chromatiaceae bacterium]|nr:deoxycytidylate deaminase [Chromatiaceae bacterium]HPE78732.1 anti-phage dCTP deaminase [Gammaproteobacteria bacterium]
MAGSRPLKTVQSPAIKTGKDARQLKDKIQGRQSRELVIAFSGPVGSGITSVVEHFKQCVASNGYAVHVVKLSEKIKDAYKQISANSPEDLKNWHKDIYDIDVDDLSGYDRFDKLQDLGDFLRTKYEPDILAQYAITDIVLYRANLARDEYNERVNAGDIDGDKTDLATFTVEDFVPPKTVYLIDQLKNPAEVALLQDIYGDLYYLIGTLCSEEERKQNLQRELLSEENARKVMFRDRKEEETCGQQLEKTLKYADYFIRNTEADSEHLKKTINRFINIIHNAGVITPTADEHAMYIAHSAALKSACLSRQVGASITNQSGQILATGCNDVPKFAGGLYTADDSPDLRCYNKGNICYNDDYKRRHIRHEIETVLNKHKVKNSSDVIESIFTDTRIKDLLEFSRSIHAEMDAITSLARTGSASTYDCILYTTTYPCHNCARHIIAAGIRRVVYIEPYEKSLALELHGEAISSDTESDYKVIFTHFEGVAPRKYQDFFLSNMDRKEPNTGKGILNEEFELKPKIHPYLDSYRTLESRVAGHFQENTFAPKDD